MGRPVTPSGENSSATFVTPSRLFRRRFLMTIKWVGFAALVALATFWTAFRAAGLIKVAAAAPPALAPPPAAVVLPPPLAPGQKVVRLLYNTEAVQRSAAARAAVA